MLSDYERRAAANISRVLQIIVLALAAGPAAFLAFVALRPMPQEEREKPLLTAPLAAGAAAAAAIMAVVLPQVIGSQQRKALAAKPAEGNALSPTAGDVMASLGGYQTRRIIAAALLEGAAFFNIVAYMFERQTYSAAIAVALIVGVLMLFPLRSLVEQWLERELRTVRELRELNG